MPVVVAVPTGGNDVLGYIETTITPRDEVFGGGLKKAHILDGDGVSLCKLLGIVMPHWLATIET